MADRELGLKARMQMRSHATGDQVLTTEDHEQLSAYSQKLDEAIGLLREEIKSIDEGRLSSVGRIYPQKAEILKWLEHRAPLVEPFLSSKFANEHKLPHKLAILKDLLEQDGLLLRQMANVAASISREIQKVINRDSLDGLYGKTGEKLSKTTRKNQAVDQKI